MALAFDRRRVVALVVVVLLSFLAMANGFQHTLTSSGADDVAIILRGGSQAEINSTVSREQVRLIEEGPGIARGSDGKPLVSAELYLVVDGLKRSSQTKANLPLRGIGKDGASVRNGIKMVEGRMFNPGPTRSLLVGRSCASSRASRSAKPVAFATSRWTVVGVFAANGSVFRVGDLGRSPGGAELVQSQ